jgi:hypothetical protein
MKDIQFRAWSFDRNEMFDLGFLADCLYRQDFAEEFGSDLTRYKILQFTGLSDDQRKPIFEGDLIERCPQGHIGIVEFANGGFIFKMTTPDGRRYDRAAAIICDRDDEDHYLVRGNMYQNRELIYPEV